MKPLDNPFRHRSDAFPDLVGIPGPSTDITRVEALLSRCPVYKETPLIQHDRLTQVCKVSELYIKDERARMGLGSFKALGAAYAIATDAQKGDVSDATYVTASAGNHGLSVAAGARAFGARAQVVIAETVPEAFAARLRSEGAEVIRAGATYEDSMIAAATLAEDNDWTLLSDSSWPGYTDMPHRVMEGYLMLMGEAIVQMPAPPTHIFLQAGVGGMASACAALARYVWHDKPHITIVEPQEAPALHSSISAGEATAAKGGVSAMGRLDCKEPSLIALKGLAQDADTFMLISEAQGKAGAGLCAHYNLKTTPSGAAGIAGLLAAKPPTDARVLVILSEGPE